VNTDIVTAVVQRLRSSAYGAI